jgi:uncharacterized DUF497 family protein
VTERFLYRFDWDIRKAMANWHKHGVSFEMAATVFRDPLALSSYDAEHSGQSEDRWITVGLVETGQLVVVVHTFEELHEEARIGSFRLAMRQYMSGDSTRAANWQHKATTMRNEYDFSNAERGKFYRKDAMLELPIYLDPKVREYLAARAKAKGIEVDQLVNEMLRKDIELIEMTK